MMILHSDANCFYASVEMVENPDLRDQRIAVCGDPEQRHGIVLTANYPAKRMGVKTGMANWQAKQACPNRVVVKPHYDLYLKYSKLLQRIYKRYSNNVEPFGMDECWISLPYDEDDAVSVAEEIRQTVKDETGLTVSIGASFSKALAKLGSDMKKPDATTVLDRDSWRERVWPLPVSDLLYVGPRTLRKLLPLGIRTIGDLAAAPETVLTGRLGKIGLMLKVFACGLDRAPVRPVQVDETIKSVGNSATAPHDVATREDARCVLYLLAESVGARLREAGFRCSTVSVSARTVSLACFSHQACLPRPTNITAEIGACACRLFEERCADALPLRSLGVSCTELVPEDAPLQTDLAGEARRERRETLDASLDGLRRRFGHQVVQRGIVLSDTAFAAVNPREEHLIHPIALLR